MRWGTTGPDRCRRLAPFLESFRANRHNSEASPEKSSAPASHPGPSPPVSEELRVALLLDPLSLSLDAQGLRVKWASHAPELARELLGRGHPVRGFGAPPGLIPRSSPDHDPEDARALGSRLLQFAPDVIVAYDALSPAALRGARVARKLGATLILVDGGWRRGLRWKDRTLRRIGQRLWGPYVRRTAGAVVALDPLAEEQVLEDGFPRELVRVIPHRVDVQAFRPRPAST